MAVYNFDTLVVINEIGNTDSDCLIGSYSKYATVPHPGTGNKIEGWRFDDRIWPTEDTNYSSYVPALTNKDLSYIDEAYFESGVGTNDSCKVEEVIPVHTTGFQKLWAPSIQHGYYYDHKRDYYLFSDGLWSGVVPVTPPESHVVFETGQFFKPGCPILARRWQWDNDNARYTVVKSFTKKYTFTGVRGPGGVRLPTWDEENSQIIWDNVDTTNPEFIVRITDTGAVLTFNQDCVYQHIVDVGISNGSPNQIFHIPFAPLTGSVNITGDTPGHEGTTYTANQYSVDKDLAIIIFDKGVTPPAGQRIVVSSTASIEVQSELENTPDTYTAITSKANINPLFRTSNRGFILIKDAEPEPEQIVLEANLNKIATNIYGPLNIGNSLGSLIATVTNKNGEFIENCIVNFNILETLPIGYFANNQTTVQTLTRGNGKAKTYYLPPRSIDDISEYIDSSGFLAGPTNSRLTVKNIKVSDTQSEIYLYKVFYDDPTQGIPLGEGAETGMLTDELRQFYREFFTTEHINGIGTDREIKWEQRRRLISNLLTPTAYNKAFRNGRKAIVATWNPTAISAEHELPGEWLPLQPTSITKGDNTYIYFPAGLDVPDETFNYMLVSPTTVRIQASAYNETRNTTIYSNIIEIQLIVPSAMNGTVLINSLNDLPPDVIPYTLPEGTTGTLALGWRLPTNSCTFASALGGVTYIHIPDQLPE